MWAEGVKSMGGGGGGEGAMQYDYVKHVLHNAPVLHLHSLTKT